MKFYSKAIPDSAALAVLNLNEQMMNRLLASTDAINLQFSTKHGTQSINVSFSIPKVAEKEIIVEKWVCTGHEEVPAIPQTPSKPVGAFPDADTMPTLPAPKDIPKEPEGLIAIQMAMAPLRESETNGNGGRTRKTSISNTELLDTIASHPEGATWPMIQDMTGWKVAQGAFSKISAANKDNYNILVANGRVYVSKKNSSVKPAPKTLKMEPNISPQTAPVAVRSSSDPMNITPDEIIDLLKPEAGIRVSEYKALTQFGNKYLANTIELLANTGYNINVYDDPNDGNRKHIRAEYKVEVIKKPEPKAIPKDIPKGKPDRPRDNPIFWKEKLNEIDLWSAVEEKIPYTVIRDEYLRRIHKDEIRAKPNVMKILEHIANTKKVVLRKGDDDIFEIVPLFK